MRGDQAIDYAVPPKAVPALATLPESAAGAVAASRVWPAIPVKG